MNYRLSTVDWSYKEECPVMIYFGFNFFPVLNSFGYQYLRKVIGTQNSASGEVT